MNLLLVAKMLAEFPEEAAKVREMAKLGVHVSVVVPSRWLGKSVDAQRLASDGYEVLMRDCWFCDRMSKRIRYHLHFYPGISQIIRDRDWDLVHLDEEPMNVVTYHAFRACRNRNVRTVFTTWQNVMKRYPPPFEFLESYVFENATGAIAGNRDAVNILRRRGFRQPVARVPQRGVDPTLFQRLDASSLREQMGFKDAFVIGFVGQVVYRKGLDTLIKVLELLPKKCALVLVGSGPDGPKLKSLAREFGVSERVQWEPWVDQREIAKYMCAFDVLVVPSRTVRSWKEQFGRVLIEAMACETPVVGSDSGDIPNVIGDAGLIFHEDDVRELAGHLLRLMEDAALRETLGHRGRERVLEHFTYERVAKDTMAFYKQLCSLSE